MPSVSQSINTNVLTTLQTSLTSDNVQELHQFLLPDSHLDISSFWTRANQANDSANATAACKIISQLLVKIDGDKEFTSPGTAFIRRILTEHSKSIFRNLSSGRPMYVNPTLRLLLTMSQFDLGALANEVYVAMDFGTFKTLPKLLARSGPQTQKSTDEKVSLGKRKREEGATKDATRGLFIALLFTFLNHAQSTSKTELLQRRPIVTELFKHLSYDPEASVQKTLKGLIAILESRDIARPAKVQFFNEWTLTQLLALYNRDDMPEEGSTTLRDHIQAFFLKATTIPDQGICFASTGLVPPTNKKLYNPILASFVTSLRPTTDELQYDLLLAILTKTPELIAHWLQNTNLDLSPRLEVEWIKAMGLIERILSIPFPDNTSSNLEDIPDYVIIENILPSPTSKILGKGLQHESDLVKLMCTRSLSQSINKAGFLRDTDDKAMDILSAVRRRAPLIEVLLPIATLSTTKETSEEIVLLREEVLSVLSAYVNTFEDLPNFDFIALFNSIMCATSREKLLDTDTMVTGSIETASDKEKDLVLKMTDNIEVQWLSKKKGSKSILSVIIHHIVALPPHLQESKRNAISVLDSLVRRDSFMFSTEINGLNTPVAKVEALFTAIAGVRDPGEITDIVKFIEDSMIHFQTSPYKYWDALVDLCEEGQSEACANVSPILTTFSEQIAFSRDKEYIQSWFGRVVALLVAIGENTAICEKILGTNRPILNISDHPSLWNVITILQDIVSNDVCRPVSWEQYRKMSQRLVLSDQAVLKTYAVEQWNQTGHLLRHSSSEVLETLTQCYTKDDVSASTTLQRLLTKCLFLQTCPVSKPPSAVVSPQVALDIFGNISESDQTSSYAVGELLDSLGTEQQEVMSSKLFKRLQNLVDLRNSTVLAALGRAIRRRAMAQFDLAAFLFPDEPSLIQLHPKEVADCIGAHISTYPSAEIPSAFLRWSETALFQDACAVIVPLLDSAVQETQEIAKRLLDAHRIDIPNSLGEFATTIGPARIKLLRCVQVKAENDSSFRHDLQVSVMTGLSSTAPLSTFRVQILNIVTRISTSSFFDEYKEMFKQYDRNITSSLTRRFAEDRKQEQKELSSEVLEFVEAAVSYVQSSSSFVSSCGQGLLNPLIEAAFENQLHHSAVLRFVHTVAQSTSYEAYNYTRAIQNIFAHPNRFENTEIKALLIKLLHKLILQDLTRANISVMDEILRLYGGTVSSNDQLLYEILKALESSTNVSFGTRIKSWRLVETRDEANLDTRSIDAVLSSDLALSTVLNFRDHDDSTANLDSDLITYDLRFILPLIAGFMQSDPSISMMKQLLQHHALGLSFLSLSSTHHEIRTLGSLLLTHFNNLLTASTIRERSQILTILGLARDSITQNDLLGAGIPRLQAVFLGLAVDVLMTPSHPHYEQINRFLLSRPHLDLFDVPMFLALFNSHENYGRDVNWLLRLMKAGVCQGCEGHGFRRRHVLEMSMGLYRARTATTRIKEGIVEFLRAAVKDEGMRRYFEQVGGICWLKLGDEPELEDIRDIVFQ